MRLLDINRRQQHRKGRVEGKRCFFLFLHYISGPETQQGISPPAFPPREYGPEAGKRNGEGDRTDANRDVPRGVLGKKSPPDEERGLPGNDFFYNTPFKPSSTIPRSVF